MGLENKKVLAVGDEPDFISILRDALDISEANYIQANMRDLEGEFNQFRVDNVGLIILDDPKLSLIHRLRAPGSFFREVPIVVTTVDADPDFQVFCRKLGVSDYFIKPGINVDDFESRVKALLNKDE